MLRSTATAVRELLDEQRVLSLAVVVDGAPTAGLLPFATLPEAPAVIVHASRLARHTRGLTDGALVNALIHEPDGPGRDPLQLRRVSFECVVRPLVRGQAAWAEARRRYLARFPDAAVTFELADFTLYLLEMQHGRYIGGFGKAVEVPADDMRRIMGPA
jgi:putative heme iron utilization protein